MTIGGLEMPSSVPSGMRMSAFGDASIGDVGVSILASSREDDYYGGGGRGYGDVQDDVPPSYRRRQQKSAGFLSLFQNQKRLGATLLALGLLFTTFGMMLFFEGNLLRLGNMFMISGITFLLGPNKVRGFFMKAERMQATIITSVGVFLVFTGKPRMGILCEIFGLLNLFGNMFPYLLAIGKNIPIVGDVIKSFTGEGSKAAF